MTTSEDLPACWLGEVQGDGLFVAAFMQETTAAEVAVDIVFEHVRLAAEATSFRRGEPPGGSTMMTLPPVRPGGRRQNMAFTCRPPVAGIPGPGSCPGPRVWPSRAGMEPALKDGGDFPRRLGANLRVIDFFKSGNWGQRPQLTVLLEPLFSDLGHSESSSSTVESRLPLGKLESAKSHAFSYGNSHLLPLSYGSLGARRVVFYGNNP